MDQRRQPPILGPLQSWQGPGAQPGEGRGLSRNTIPWYMLWGAGWGQDNARPSMEHSDPKADSPHVDRETSRVLVNSTLGSLSSACMCPEALTSFFKVPALLIPQGSGGAPSLHPGGAHRSFSQRPIKASTPRISSLPSVPT